MKRRINQLMVMMAALCTLGMASCSTHVYDEDTYQEIVKYLSPVDSVDQRHDWRLTEYGSYRFTVNAGVNIDRVQVYSANPLTDANAELMNQVFVTNEQTVSMAVSRPKILREMYAALADSLGNMYVTPFSATQTYVDFSNATKGVAAGRLQPQTFTYLYEENFPEPGDYDYNDLVMRISLLRTGRKEVTVNVTVAAVGAERQMAGAIRLVGFRYQDIDSIKTTTGETFNDGVPDGSLYVFDNMDILTKGRNNEAVINLFVDAHWAINYKVEVDYGLFKRYKYNVSLEHSTDTQLKSMQTISYVVYFNKEDGLNNLTLDMIDPFICYIYNTGYWEAHQFMYCDAQTLYNYPLPEVKDLPWAMVVPMRNFAHPLEGEEIGFKKKGFMFGAYMTEGYSFGEWAENYKAYHDWYKYPTSGLVFDLW